MKKIIALLSFLLIIASSSNAQYAFKILAAKGNNLVFKNGNWNSAKAGTKLLSTEKIKLNQNCYLGLIHSTGKTIELKESGEFLVQDLEKKIIAGKSGFGSKYGKFVADGMFSANENAAASYEKTGSTTRDINSKIVIYAPLQMDAVKNIPFRLYWNECEEVKTYVVILKDLFNEPIYQKESNSSSIVIDFTDPSIPEMPGGNYLLEIHSKDDPLISTASGGVSLDNNYKIQILEKEKGKKIKATIDYVKQGINENSALDYMILAAAYEKEGLIIYAVDSYHKAKELAPDINDYKIQYEEYIKTKINISSLKNH